jgi:hypothetical protein
MISHHIVDATCCPAFRRLDDPEVKDVDFCPHAAAAAILQQQQQQQQPSSCELLATVGGSGECQIWEVQPSQQQLVATLEPPKGESAVTLLTNCLRAAGALWHRAVSADVFTSVSHALCWHLL